MKKHCIRYLILFLILFLLAGVGIGFARAGGAGGSSGSGGFSGGSDDGDIIYFLIYLVWILWDVLGPVPTLILVSIIGTALFIQNRMVHKKTNSIHQTTKLNRATNSNKNSEVQKFIASNPDFSREEFLQRVRTAFFSIQQAWQDKSMAGVRKYVSDGLYQRFTTQFLMQNLLVQENRLSNIKINRVWIHSAYTDHDIQVLDVGINTSLTDKFICKTNPSMNSGGQETFTEYWTFTRKTGIQTRTDIYHSDDCPQCSAPLPPDLGERGQCPYCYALINSGAFDWVLGKITQVEDYGVRLALENQEAQVKKAYSVLSQIPELTVQNIEDHGSNAFMQISSAITRKKPEEMRRFTQDQIYTKLSQTIPREQVVYNRIFINHATLISAGVNHNKIEAAIVLRVTTQRAILENKKARLLDPTPFTEDKVLLLERTVPEQSNQKGSLLMHQCPSCGATIQDSLETKCPYCGIQYTGASHDWVVSDLLNLRDYTAPRGSAKIIRPKAFENLYDVKDFALINMMVVLAADGVFSPEEREFARNVAKSLGFDPTKLESLFTQASAGRLGIRMPHQVNKRGKIFKLMEEAAAADGIIDPREEEILRQVKASYML